MPFFCFNINPNLKKMNTRIKKKNNKKTRIATLQVRIQTGIKSGRKRVFSFTSASMTVEAALVLPLFLFAGVILMMPFQILDTERQMQAIVNSVGEDISQTAYLVKEGKGSLAAYAYAEGAVRMKAKELPVEGLSLAGSKLLDDGETVNLVVMYQIRLPFSVFSLASIKRTNACYLRAWIGQEGGLGGNPEGDDEEDPIVYVGRDSTRYHLSASCHYLDNHLTAVSADQVESYRNESGSRYTPCARCGSQAGGTVYIMPSGEHYHSSRSCSAIQAYVSAVRKSTVEYLGPCSYCSGG